MTVAGVPIWHYAAGVIGLGCMRLSTDASRDDARSHAVLTAALAAGVELLDTADAYCLDDTETGHNESLVARALAAANSRARVATKGGLVRPGGTWQPDGRARHLEAAARASQARLGAIDLYLLHAIDPKTSFATSVRALARIHDAGIARAVGLANVNLTQLEQALAIVPVAAVEVELSPWHLDALRGGVVDACRERAIPLLAHRPLGGPAGVQRALRDPVLAAIAERHAATAVEIVLAWLRSLAPNIAPLPGATRVETAASAVRGQRLVLDEDARKALAERFVSISRSRGPDLEPRRRRGAGDRGQITSLESSEDMRDSTFDPHDIVLDPDSSGPSRSGDRPPPREIVMLMGMPASGKSTLAIDYVARGYERFNRDERGGSLLDIARAVGVALAGGAQKIVVDNTYPTRASRTPLLEIARMHDAAVRCVVVATPLEDAQAYAAARILARTGTFDARREILPGVQFRFRRDYEPPRPDEGFADITEVTPPRQLRGTHPGLVVELDGIVWTGKPMLPDKIALVDGARDALAAWSDHVVAATVWRPGAAPAAIAALAARLGELLGRAIDVRHCPHLPGPPVCWCRKPLPGLAVALLRDHDLDPVHTIHVGRGAADRGFAQRAGMRYVAIEDGWPTPP